MPLAANSMSDPAVEAFTYSYPDAPAPSPGKIISGRYSRAADYHMRRRAGTRDWLITYTLSGEGCYRLGSFTHFCRRGQVVTLAPGTPHDYATAETGAPWVFFWAHFNPRLQWVDWLQRGEVHPGLHVLFISDSSTRLRLGQAFNRLVRDSGSMGIFQEDLAQNALEEILTLVARQHGRNARRFDPRIEMVLYRLEDSLGTPLAIAELAKMVSLSPSRLAHLFKEQVGDSVIEVHLKLRLRHASRLLERTPRSIGEIAGDIGFESPFHFSRQFKAYYGMSPSAYRKRCQGEA